MDLTKKKLIITLFSMIISSIVLSAGLFHFISRGTLRAVSNDFDPIFGILEANDLVFGSPSLFAYLGIIFGFQVIILLIILMSKGEYRQYLLSRSSSMPIGAHRLSMQDVLDNENRSRIIDLIMEQPGIHYSQIIRETSLSPGNLTWHLEILELYKIVKIQLVGKYVVYFPYYLTNPLSEIDLKIQKSTTCMEILDKIQNAPGITQAQIAKELAKNHKTVKYHLEKLFEAELIRYEKGGRRKLLFPVIRIE